MCLRRNIGILLVGMLISAAVHAEGYYGDYPSVLYVKPGTEGLKAEHAVGLSAFRPNLLANPNFDDGENGWSFSSSQLEHKVLSSTETGEKYLRLNKLGTATVYASGLAAPNGTYGNSYINGAALIEGPAGKEGLVSLIIQSSKIKTPIEKKLRFKFTDDGWNLVQFNFAQNLKGHKNLKLSFRFYPRVKGYQRLAKLFLDIIPASEVNLSSGVPATTTGSRNDCFAAGELVAYDQNMPRVTVAGCSAGVIVPQSIVESYKVYMPDNQTVNCRTNRANEFHTRYLNQFLSELTAIADASARDPAAPGAQCAANMMGFWAEQNAMATVSPHGYTQQARFDRMWVYGGIGATYLKNPHIRARATELNKDEVIREWLQTIATQLSTEIDVDRADGGQNNIQFWRAFSILPTALMNEDAALLANSRLVFAEAMEDIIDDTGLAEADKGYLLSELKRLTRAAGYHGYADKPLLGMALYSQAYGCDFMAGLTFNKQQITRLTRKAMQGYYEPEVFSQAIEQYLDKSGVDVQQSDYRELMYLAHTLDPAISADVSNFIQTRTGNTLSRTYGSTERDDRLGGSYVRLKEVLPLLRPLNPGALAAYCPY